ncbi:hypoxanthine phosphoribosyltransferase [Mycoplasma sp. ES3157-GEN-MYC]|uniref:Hypoxanthine phosphoribosyltransferase n=1 Tax=Mycoplasma miroungigenitalium TaxID=754515 RepID=A0A6M4JE21_9MOLU|nr:hypoxanthine phosphoribosyltransferase [Mycoplasma miroungigenitalium]MBU4690218.1 hypoxanthine phosphoribosyltransferase [Mycoplasma miroungigenitalium]QJR43322.1 hypoxanthine phosphoribosyltransferase [Mycoplasma miroungigenitalium]
MDQRFTKILLTRDEIESKIKEMANWVNETYKDSTNLILVGLLKGAVPFLAQLIKDINVENEVAFMIASSYEGGSASTGNVKIVMDLETDIEGRDVLIVEDIIDSGITLQKISSMLKNRHPKSYRIITLLDKPHNRKVDLKPDKAAFVVPDEFLVGYGLDYEEKFRGAPFVGVFDPNKK